MYESIPQAEMSNTHVLYEMIGEIISEQDKLRGRQALIEISKISKVTLWRWESGTVNKNPPKAHLLLNLLKVHSKEEKVIKVLENIKDSKYSKLAEYVEETMGLAIVEEATFIDASAINSEFEFYYYYMVGVESGQKVTDLYRTLSLVQCRKAGLLEQEIKEDAFKRQEADWNRISEKFIRMGLISIEDGVIKRTNLKVMYDHPLIPTWEITLDSLILKPENYSYGVTGRYSFQESVDLDTAKKAANILKKAFSEVHKLVDGAASSGPNCVPFKYSVSAETLTFSSLSDIIEEKEQRQ